MKRENVSRLAYQEIPMRFIEPELIYMLLRINEIPEYDLNNKPTVFSV